LSLDITFVTNLFLQHQQKLEGMIPFYHVIKSLWLTPKRYALLAVTLLIIAAAPILLPTFSTHTFSVDENTATDAPVGQIMPKTDANDDALHFELIEGNISNAFKLAADGKLSVLNADALDYEETPTFSLTVRVTAGKETPSPEFTDITVLVNLNNVAEAALVNTEAASVVSEKGAILHGTARSNGAATVAAFQWGSVRALPEVADPGLLPEAQILTAGAAATTINLPLSSLEPNTTYYYRLVAQNSKGVVYGETLSFKTSSIPTVLSIRRNGASPTKTSSVSYRVKFSEAVSGVDANDFELEKGTGVSAAILSVAAASTSEYDVTVNGISGNGTLKLRFRDNNTVLSGINVPVGGSAAADFSGGEAYLLDNTAPGITITSPIHPYTQIGPLTYTITYSEASSITLTPADVEVVATEVVPGKPAPSGTIEITGTGNLERKVVIRSITGDGTIKIRIKAGTAVDAAGNTAGMSDYSKITIVDNTSPEGVCPADVTVVHSGGSCNPFVKVALPTHSDINEPGVVTITNDFTKTADASSDKYPVGKTTLITWRFEDQSGNYFNCTSTVTIEDKAPPVVTAPADITVGTDPGRCDAKVDYGVITATDCGGDVTLNITGPASGSRFPTGAPTVVSYTAKDPSGNTSTGSFKITVIDTEAPVIKCPAIQTHYEVAEGENDVLITYSAVTATDNCTAASEITIERVSGFASGTRLSAGSYTYKFKATDKAGNVAECSFTVVVVDNDAPMIIIGPPSVPITTHGPVWYDVTYYGTTGISLTANDISLNLTGTAQAGNITVTTTNNPNVRRVTLSNISGNGTIGINIAAGTATDGTNLAPAAGPSETFIVDNTDPVVGGGDGGGNTGGGGGGTGGGGDGGSGGGGSGGVGGGIGNAEWTFEDTAKTLYFSVTDNTTSASELDVKVTAANTALIPAAGISLSKVNGSYTLKITPAADLDGSSAISITVKDRAGNTTVKTFTLTVVAVADKPNITLAQNPIEGEEEANIPLGIGVSLKDRDGSESLIGIYIEGVPADAALSAGTNLGDGKWQLSQAQLADLTIRTENFDEDILLTIRAISEEASNHPQVVKQAERVVELLITIRGVNDAPSFSLSQSQIRQVEDFSHTSGDVTIYITDLADVDTDLSAIAFSLDPVSVDWVDISLNAEEQSIVLKSVDNKNKRQPFTFTLTADDEGAVNNLYSQTFTVQIDSLNDAPYGKVGEEPLVFEIETEAAAELFPAIYKDVDMQDEASTEKLTVAIEVEGGTPEWLRVENIFTTDLRWISQLVANPPREAEGMLFKVKAFATDEHGVNLLNPGDLDENGEQKRYDEFWVKIVCNNALPEVAEEETTISLYMNQQPNPAEPHYEFSIEDDAKALVEGAEVLEVTATEVDETIISKVELVKGAENEWRLWVTPVDNQYGETTFKIQINDLAYCKVDETPREPVFITVHVVIKLRDVLDIPTLITPNGDGDNDTWNIFGLEEFGKHEVRVFDNRGRIIFSSNIYGPGKEWDGTLNGKPMPDGTYTYQIVFNEGKDKRQGHITIAR
jgi:gliding motility-associated-like protein